MCLPLKKCNICVGPETLLTFIIMNIKIIVHSAGMVFSLLDVLELLSKKFTLFIKFLFISTIL